MMTFDNLKDKLSSTGKDVSDKAKETASLAKVRAQIAAEENKLKGLYTDLGKAYYENPEDEGIAAYRDSIDAEKAVILSYQREEASMRGLKTCPVCGAVMAKDVVYCSKCGAKYEPVEEPEEEKQAKEEAAVKHCPVCDAVVTDDMAFCEVCGTRLSD